MSWKFCTSGAAVRKAGVRANSTITVSGAALADWCDEAEAYVSNAVNLSLSGAYGTLTHPGKVIIGKVVSAMVAQNIAAYDPLAYGSQRAAETIMDKLEDEKTEGIAQLKDAEIKAYLGIT